MPRLISTEQIDINQKQPYQYNPQKVPEQVHTVGTRTETTKGVYVGSIKSDKYHYPTCSHAKKILPENEIWFKTVKEAKDAKYVPCGGCRPPAD
jgi:micrococcal nuclease